MSDSDLRTPHALAVGVCQVHYNIRTIFIDKYLGSWMHIFIFEFYQAFPLGKKYI
jgi:hypothetical protein